MGQINGSQLQWITEQKSSLLATLDYLEQLRRKEPNSANSVDISQRWQENYCENAATTPNEST